MKPTKSEIYEIAAEAEKSCFNARCIDCKIYKPEHEGEYQITQDYSVREIDRKVYRSFHCHECTNKGK